MTRPLLVASALTLAALLAAATPSTAQNQTNPIPGIDIVVKKQPGGSATVIGKVGSDNAFAGQVRLPAGEYSLTTACRRGASCPAHRLTSLTVNGRSLPIDGAGGIKIAVGDFNGDGRADLTTFRGTIQRAR